MSVALTKRYDDLDVAKGIGIILVLIGHLLIYGSAAFSYIFSFHMPLFFFLSGVVYKVDDILCVKALTKKIYNGIVLPLILFTFIGLVLFAIRLESPFPDSYKWVNYYFRIVNECCIGGIAGWFLACLAGAKFLYWFIRKIRVFEARLLVLIICFFLGDEIGLLPRWMVLIVPCKILAVPMAVFYLGMGYELRELIVNLMRDVKRNKFTLLVESILFFTVVALCQNGQTPNLAIPAYANPSFLLVASASGIAGVVAFSHCVVISRSSLVGGMLFKPLRFIGRHSLIFFLLEGHVNAFIFLALTKFGSITVHPMLEYIPYSLIAFIVSVNLSVQAACVPLLEKLLDFTKSHWSIK